MRVRDEKTDFCSGGIIAYGCIVLDGNGIYAFVLHAGATHPMVDFPRDGVHHRDSMGAFGNYLASPRFREASPGMTALYTGPAVPHKAVRSTAAPRVQPDRKSRYIKKRPLDAPFEQLLLIVLRGSWLSV